ncbi:MAG: hypothetical protein E7231_03215 [Cellulosilyticum sp.]|nr:hypothetical protein [Cellulosilyticum sp.]
MKNKDKYIPYLELMNTLGQGVMILPQLWTVVNHFKITNKSTFYRHINKMIEINIIRTVEVERVKIIYFTQLAADLICLNKTIATSKIANTRTLNNSMLVTQYAIKFILPKYNAYEEFLNNGPRMTNLFSSNAAFYKCLEEDYYAYWKNSAAGRNFTHEYEYLQYTEMRKIAQLTGTHKALESVVKPAYTLNNLRSRGMYLTEVKGDPVWLNVQVVMLESDTKLISANNFALDVEVLEKWSYKFPYETIRLQIVVKPYRQKAVELIVRKFLLKHNFPFVIEVVTMDSAMNEYFKTSAIFLELNDAAFRSNIDRKTSTIKFAANKFRGSVNEL